MVLIAGTFRSVGFAFVSVHVKVCFPVVKFRGLRLHCFSIDNALTVSAVELCQDILIWRAQEIEEMNPALTSIVIDKRSDPTDRFFFQPGRASVDETPLIHRDV
jgi:hypothetical protein